MFQYVWRKVFKRNQPAGVLPRLAAPEPWPERDPHHGQPVIIAGPYLDMNEPAEPEFVTEFAYLRGVFDEMAQHSPPLAPGYPRAIKAGDIGVAICRFTADEDARNKTLVVEVRDGDRKKAVGYADIRRRTWPEEHALYLRLELYVDHKLVSANFIHPKSVFGMRRTIVRWMIKAYKENRVPKVTEAALRRELALQHARNGAVVPEHLRKYLPGAESEPEPAHASKGCVEQVAEAGVAAGLVGVVVADELTMGLSTSALRAGIGLLSWLL